MRDVIVEVMTTPKRKLRAASTGMIEERARAVEWVLDLIELTGGCRASFVSDRTRIRELLNDPADTRQAFSDLFGKGFTIGFDLFLPEFVDAIQAEFPEWPGAYSWPEIRR